MASIDDINSSSDSEDCDYVPHEELSDVSVDESEDESAVEESEFRGKGKTKKSKKKVSQTEEIAENPKPDSSEADNKQRTEDIWKKFLDDVGTSSVKKDIPDKNNTNIELVNNNKKNLESKCTDLKLDSDKHSISPKTNLTTEVFEFAGESVIVTKETNIASSAPNILPSSDSNTVSDSKAQPKPIKRQGGLGSLVGNIMNKKPKMTVLQKSLHDWNSFKKEEGLEEDLEKFNKGKGGFLEKQAFLQRSDVRQFELEKSIRLANKTKR